MAGDRSSTGRPTGIDVIGGKFVRRDKEGVDIFEDYWTDSGDELVKCLESDLKKNEGLFDEVGLYESGKEREISDLDLSVSASPQNNVPVPYIFSASILTPKSASFTKDELHFSNMPEGSGICTALNVPMHFSQDSAFSEVGHALLRSKRATSPHSLIEFQNSRFDSGLGVSFKHDFSTVSRKIKSRRESLPEEFIAQDSAQVLSCRKRLQPYSLEQLAAAFESCPDVNFGPERPKYSSPNHWQAFSKEQLAAGLDSCPEEIDLQSKRQKYPPLDRWQSSSLEQLASAFESCPENVNRRSKRQRYPPLDHWRNQRLKYCFKKGKILCLGVDDGTPEDRSAINSLKKSLERRLQTRPDKNVAYKFYDDGREFNIHLAKMFSAVPWPKQYALKPYRVKIVFKTEFLYFGYLEIDGFDAMRSRCLSGYDLQMAVVRGRIEVRIQCNKIEAWYKDTFFVPGGNQYWIKNLEKRKALLSFTFGKFKFLKSSVE